MTAYPVLSVLDFGRQLIDTGDLDPVYIMLRKARERRVMSEVELRRWCLAYWLLYRADVSTLAAKAHNFWDYVGALVNSSGGPRGSERRHFRGAKAAGCVAWLRGRFPQPEGAVYSLLRTVKRGEPAQTFNDVSARVRTWPMFGPWIAFKIADMIERVLKIPIDFRDCELDIYDEPLKGGWLVYCQETFPGPLRPLPEEYDGALSSVHLTALSWSLSFLQSQLGHLAAPPSFDRRLNVQEFETILCKYKSHVNGHYPIGKDSREIREVLNASDDNTCIQLAKFLPNGVV